MDKKNRWKKKPIVKKNNEKQNLWKKKQWKRKTNLKEKPI